MLGNNFEKKALISSTITNEWPQNNQNLMASTTNMAMEKQTQQQPQQQQALKCPRCDSSNTKFCYYNNYSLSQPRHFCKACKRYWTRGGTLRNVPVGGGCRKNKRVKKPSSAATAIDSSPSSSSAPLVTTNPSSHSQMDHINPLFYGLHSSTLSFPRFNNNSRIHDTSAPVYEYDLDHQPQVNGLGFSSSGLMASTHDVTSKSLLLNHPLAPIFGSLNLSTISASSSDSPNMVSLIASNLQQHQKFIPGGGSRENTRGANNFHGFSPYEDHMQMQGNNQMEQIGAISPDPNSLFWNATGVGANNWLDPPNIGSSVPFLI